MVKLPDVGLGLWKVSKNECAEVVYQAIKMGYRHLDCASDYGNEIEVGQGIARALNEGLCERGDLWVTSKLWNTYHSKEHVRPALEKTLSDLQLDYLDLYLIHFPIAQAFVPFETRYPAEWLFDPDADKPQMKLAKVPLHQTWEAMEELVDSGVVKYIGACNYTTGLVHDLINYARIAPAVLQFESHPYLTQEPLIRTCKQYNIKPIAFSPLGSLSYVELDMAKQNETLLEHPVVKNAAQALGKSPAQVLLRWNIQRGCAVVAKSSNPARLEQNLALSDFELPNPVMADISALNQNRRFNDPGVFCEAAFNTFHAIYD